MKIMINFLVQTLKPIRLTLYSDEEYFFSIENSKVQILKVSRTVYEVRKIKPRFE